MFRPPIRTTAAAVALALGTSVFLACSDDSELNAPDLAGEPQQVVVDLTGGHFRYLAPLGDGAKAGTFNASLAPVVEVCRLLTTTEPTATTPCDAVVARFSMHDGASDERITVDRRKEMYSVGWDLSRYSLATGFYRIFVRTAFSTGAGATTLGFSDVAVAPSKNEAKALAGTGSHPLTSTSTLPIKFRIEYGALCGGHPDCFEGSVGPGGGTFVTPAGFAGVEFPAGALNDTRTLLIYRLTADDVAYCLPTRQPQYEGCYRYLLEPALSPGETFEVEATVGVCLDPAAVPFEDQMILQKWDEHDPATLTTLPRREIEFLECADFSLASIEGAGAFSTLASAGSRFVGALASAIMPQPLYAGTRSPYGGGLNDFSRVGWVRPLTLSIAAGQAQTACAATPLPVDPTVRVTSAVTGAPIPGITIKFGVSPNGGSVSPASATTDAAGFASVTWTLGIPGSHNMVVSGRGSQLWPNYAALSINWGVAHVSANAQAC